ALSAQGASPAGALVDLAAAHVQVMEAVVEADEALMEKYLSEGAISPEELQRGLPKALASGTLVPIFCTSAKKDKDIGIDELLDALTLFGLSPAQAKPHVEMKGSGDQAKEITLVPSESSETVGQVFKTLSDKFVGLLSYIRLYSGRLTPD